MLKDLIESETYKYADKMFNFKRILVKYLDTLFVKEYALHKRHW